MMKPAAAAAAAAAAALVARWLPSEKGTIETPPPTPRRERERGPAVDTHSAVPVSCWVSQTHIHTTGEAAAACVDQGIDVTHPRPP